MSLAVIVPLLLGVIGVLQAALNRRIAGTWGLLPTTLLNALVFTSSAAICVVLVGTSKTPLADWIKPVSLRDLRALWFLPGVFGFAIVAGLPWSLGRIGALGTFVSMIAAQMVASVALDYFAEGMPMTWSRLLGAALAIAGAVLVALR